MFSFEHLSCTGWLYCSILLVVLTMYTAFRVTTIMFSCFVLRLNRC